VSNVDQTYRNLLIQHVIGTVPAIYSCSVSRSDDILLISSSITNLERLLHRCEHELVWLDMSINLKKNHPVYESALAVMQRVLSLLYSSTGRSLPWVEEVRYLGVHFVKSRSLKCSLDEAKRGFFRATNAIFEKIGRVASEEVVLGLAKCKCLPILLYGLECCPLNKSDVKSLDFAVTRFLMKLFKSVNLLILT